MKSKLVHVVLSVVIAFALWVYVISVVSPESEETFYDVPVTYQNDVLEERGLMIVSENPTVTLRLKGNRSDLNELNANNITILVDLAAIQAPGTQMLGYRTNFPGNIPSNAIDILSQSPNILQLKVENKVKKTVDIRLEYVGSVPEDYIAEKDNPIMDTTTVEVVGPESAVSKVDHAVIQVDLTDKAESIIGAFPYTLCDEEGEPVDGELLVTNIENVNLSVKIQRVKEVPLVLNIVEGGGATKTTCKIDMPVQSLVVSGSESKLQELAAIELGTLNLAELKRPVNRVEFDIVLPEGVTNMSGESRVTITVSFPDLAKKKLQINQAFFQTTNVPEGMTVAWITQVLEVEVRGSKEQIAEITENDIIVTMDFEGEELGNVSKMPKITISSKYPGMGAITVPAIAATLQTEGTNGTAG